MKPTITSFNGHLINDGTTYSAIFPEQSFFPQASGQSVELMRSDNSPVISAVKRQSKIVKVNIYPASGVVFTTTINQLNGWFDTFDRNLHAFVVTDESSVQWYVNARVEGQPHAYADYIQYTLRIPDPIWQQVNSTPEVWSVTATGQQHTTTLTGNRSVFPILDIKPTSAKVGGFLYMEYRAWYNPQTTVALKDEILDVANNAWDTTGLVNDTTKSNQINNVGGYNSSATTFAIDTAVGGGLPAGGGTAWIASTGEQITYTAISGGTSMTGITRGVGGTTAASVADNAVLSNSKVFADGSDFRLKIQGQGAAVDWPYWLSGFNTSTTRIWSVQDWDAGITLTLSGAMNNSDAITSLSFKQTKANLAFLKTLATKKNFMFLIGSEIFSLNPGAVVDLVNYKVTTTATDARAAYGSTKASHADGASVFWLPYVFQFCYGSNTLTTAVQDESKKPVINLSSSRNNSWVWDTNFSDVTGLRAGSWKPMVLASPGKQSVTYTQKHAAGADTTPAATLVDPSTGIGVFISAYQQGTTWRGEAARVLWSMYNGAGFTTFTVVDLVFRYSTDWPVFMGLQYSKDGKAWSKATGFPEATPATAQTWTAGATHSAVALGATYQYLRWVGDGSIASNKPNDVAAIEATSVTLVRPSASILQLGFTGASTSSYQLQCTISNVGTTDSLTIDFTLALNDTIRVDCLNKNVTYQANGANAIGALSTNAKRNYWISLEPPTTNGGVTNGGKLQFDDIGTAGVTVTITYQDRLA